MTTEASRYPPVNTSTLLGSSTLSQNGNGAEQIISVPSTAEILIALCRCGRKLPTRLLA